MIILFFSKYVGFTLDHENHSMFSPEHDRQLLMWLHRKPEDWTLSWGGAGVIYGWGHNHRGQLGGVDGAKVKIPTPCETLSTLRPVQLVGGEQTLFAITADGKVYATGKLYSDFILARTLNFGTKTMFFSFRIWSWWKTGYRRN